MDKSFTAWVGQPVVLQVALGDIKVPLRGKLLKVGGETVRMRIGDAWDVDIYKAMILAVVGGLMGVLSSAGGVARKPKNVNKETRRPARGGVGSWEWTE